MIKIFEKQGMEILGEFYQNKKHDCFGTAGKRNALWTLSDLLLCTVNVIKHPIDVSICYQFEGCY